MSEKATRFQLRAFLSLNWAEAALVLSSLIVSSRRSWEGLLFDLTILR